MSPALFQLSAVDQPPVGRLVFCVCRMATGLVARATTWSVLRSSLMSMEGKRNSWPPVEDPKRRNCCQLVEQSAERAIRTSRSVVVWVKTT